MLSKRFLSFAVAVAISFSWSAVQAAPNASSAVESGSTMTITGTGFGTHVDESGASYPYLNAAWDDYETGALESANTPFVVDRSYGGSERVRIGSSINRPNSSYYMEKYYSEANQPWPRLGGYQHSVPSGTGQLYASFWFTQWNQTESGKFWRNWTDENLQDPEPNTYHSTGGTQYGYGWRSYTESTPYSDTMWNSPFQFTAQQWAKLDMLFDENGYITAWINGVQQWSYQQYNANQEYGGGTARMIVGAMIDGFITGTDMYLYDDVYHSYTTSRVEICDSPTWGSSISCETQLPTAWSDTEITITTNYGAFNNGDTAYLFVVDENNVASDPLTITLGTTDPTIQSASESNGEIQIGGANFGTRPDNYTSDPNRLYRAWNDFESGNILVDDWQHSHGAAYSANWQAVSGTPNRSNSQYVAARNWNVSRLGSIEFVTDTGKDEWYGSLWIRIGSGCPSQDGGQGKFTRLWGDFNSENVYLSPYGTNNRIYNHMENIGLTVSSESYTPVGKDLGFDEWHRVEYHITNNPAQISIYIDGELVRDRTALPPLNWDAGAAEWSIGNMIETIQNSCYHYFDDIYFDHSQARVEICDTGTWDVNTPRHCEVQLPKSWTSTAITVDSNHGTFNTGDAVYVYVVDADGTVSDPQALTLTSGTDTTNPNLSSVTVDSTGTGVDLVFNETVVTTGYTSGDFDLDCTSAGNNISLTSPTGSGTSWSFTVGTTINSGDTCNIDFNGAANSVEDAAGNDLLTITDGSVTVVGYAADTTNPSLSSATVDNTGTGVDLVFSETVLAAGYTSGDFDLDCTTAGNDIALSSPTGSGTNWSFTIGTTVNSGDTCNLDFNGAANSIEDGAGNDLLTITDGSVTVIGLTADTTNPTLSSATVDNSGTELDAVFSESIVTTGYTSGDFDLDCTSAGNDLALSSPTGSGTNWSFTISASVNSGDSCNIDFNGAANSIEDGANNDLLSITDGPVTVIGAGSPASSGEFSAPGAGFGAIGSGLGSFQ